MLKKPLKEYNVNYPHILDANYYGDCESCNTCNTCSNQSINADVCTDTGGW